MIHGKCSVKNYKNVAFIETERNMDDLFLFRVINKTKENDETNNFLSYIFLI